MAVLAALVAQPPVVHPLAAALLTLQCCCLPMPPIRFTIKYDTEPYCNLVKQLWRDGHEIALHTRDHVRLDPPIDAEKEGERSGGGQAVARRGGPCVAADPVGAALRLLHPGMCVCTPPHGPGLPDKRPAAAALPNTPAHTSRPDCERAHVAERVVRYP